MRPNQEALIEELVQKRKHARANAAIKAWLKTNSSIESKLTASDWFRRLGDFKQAYRTIAPEDYHLNRVKAGSIEAKRYLWCARMLNLMGASAFASQIVKRLPAFEDAVENRMIANIHLTAFDSASAYIYFKLAEKLDPKPSSYASRIGVIGTCDALSGLKKYDEAIRKVRKIHFSEEEQLLRGILLQAEGEYLARSEKYKEALNTLEKAEEFFPENDQTLDRYFLSKWQAISLLGLKRSKEGVQKLNQAIEALRQPKYRAEIWLDCLYWKDFFKVASSEETSTLQCYPGLAQEFKSRYATPSEIEIGSKTNKNSFWISFSRNEWSYGPQNFHSTPKEIELLAHLRRAYPYGVSVTRLSTLLWPEEVSSFLYLEGRIQQLLRRLRNQYDIEVETKQQEVFLLEQSAKRVSVEIESDDKSPLLFQTKKTISLNDVQEFYQIKRTQAHHLVKEWLDSRKVNAKKTGRTILLEAASRNKI